MLFDIEHPSNLHFLDNTNMRMVYQLSNNSNNRQKCINICNNSCNIARTHRCIVSYDLIFGVIIIISEGKKENKRTHTHTRIEPNTRTIECVCVCI